MSVQFCGSGALATAAFLAIVSPACAPRTSHAELAFAHMPIGTMPPSAASTRELEVPAAEVEPTATPAYRYAQLDRPACETELTRRGIGWISAGDARGVLAPVRLTGAVGGVSYHTGLAPKQRATSPNEVFDCRLVLALDDFGAILARHGVVEVIHMSGWRPPAAKSWPAGKLGTRHDGALALDAGYFVRKDGTRLDVEKDFHGRIGARTCGPGTGPWPATAEAIELRSIACEAADAHLFNVELTPDYNRPHRNHFHLEVTPNVKWFIVH